MKLNKAITYEELTGTDNLVNVVSLPLDELHPFHTHVHPYRVINDAKMEETINSVREYGILLPLIVRPEDDGYEIISGHRRTFAAQVVGLKEVPALVRDLSDDEATILMVDSNIQREDLLPSEKARAYRMKLEALRHQGRRTDLTSSQLETKLNNTRSDEQLATKSPDSRASIQRYIRLTYLIPGLLQMVDDKKLPMNPGVEISYLTEEEQEWVLETIETEGAPSLAQAKALKELSKAATLDMDAVLDILMKKKAEPTKVVFKSKQLTQYFPGLTAAEMEDKILEIIAAWAEQNRVAY